MPKDDVLVSLRAVVLDYGQGTREETRALGGVDLEVKQGELVAVVGPVASGKTTLLQVIAGLLPPTTGQVTRAAEVPQKPLTAMVFQRAEDQLFCSSVYDDVAAGPRALGLPERIVRERVHAALEVVALPLEEYADRDPLRLSAGEQRRVAVAGVLAVAPALLCVDEVDAGLDPAQATALLACLFQWAKEEKGRALVYSTHDADRAAEAERVVVMESGSVRTTGSPDMVLSDADLLAAVGLTPPLPGRVALALGAQGPVPVTAHGLSLWLAARRVQRDVYR